VTAPQPSIPGLPPAAPEYVGARRAALRDYVAANEGRFTRDALTRAALDSGYEPAEVDAAFTRPNARSRMTGEVWVVAIVYVLGLYLGTAIVGGLDSGGRLYPVVLIAGFAGGIVGAIRLRDRRPSIGYGLGCGVVAAIVVPLVLALSVLGICIATGFKITG
jgi:hypothetical protein